MNMKIIVLLVALWISVSLQEAECFSALGSLASRFRFGKKSMPTLEKVLENGVAANKTVANGATFDFGDKDLEDIFKQNREWKKSREDADPGFFNKMGSVHKPKYLWIGCADARVPANEIMGEDAGSVFVARNVANMVVNTDFNLMAALQYAVNVLQVPHIIVCGHYDCGGVRASMQTKDHGPPLENWLRNIRDVYRLHQRELDSIKDPEKRHRRLVELNVIEQCINLFKTGAVQRRRVQTYKEGIYPYTTPRIHAVVFDPKVGILTPLQVGRLVAVHWMTRMFRFQPAPAVEQVNFKDYIDDLHDIYDLYTLEDV